MPLVSQVITQNETTHSGKNWMDGYYSALVLKSLPRSWIILPDVTDSYIYRRRRLSDGRGVLVLFTWVRARNHSAFQLALGAPRLAPVDTGLYMSLWYIRARQQPSRHWVHASRVHGNRTFSLFDVFLQSLDLVFICTSLSQCIQPCTCVLHGMAVGILAGSRIHKQVNFQNLGDSVLEHALQNVLMRDSNKNSTNASAVFRIKSMSYLCIKQLKLGVWS